MTEQSTLENSIVDVDLRSPNFVEDFGQLLLARTLLDKTTLARATRAQQQSGERFDHVISRLGPASETHVLALLGAHLEMPIIDAKDFPKAPILQEALRPAFLKANSILPVSLENEKLLLAISEPSSADLAAGIAYLIERPVSLALASQAEIERALVRLYESSPLRADSSAPATEEAHSDDVRQLADLGSEAPIIKLVNELIDRAAAEAASDIHIEPRNDVLAVRFRIDGELHPVDELPLALRPGITSRIKIMARLNIAEQRLPQDGRIKTTVRGRDIDLRISTMPTVKGENVVIRLLDKSTVALDFAALGFTEDARKRLDAVFNQPNGIVLVTGPTGSGKTTTLYAALTALNAPGVKIFTVEDPVEYQISAVSQIQVQPKISLTFASALRSILRQDPDIILVGEMRDLETAEIAIQAALTGHLVLSTVHTNSAAATVTRLIDMGVEPYLIASTVKAIVGQRLVRRLCVHCSQPAPEGTAAAVGATNYTHLNRSLAPPPYPHGKIAVGCEVCRGSGYSGRTTISEILIVTEPIRRAILARSSETEIEAIACSEGMTTMLSDGLAKALDGATTLDEILTTVRSL